MQNQIEQKFIHLYQILQDLISLYTDIYEFLPVERSLLINPDPEKLISCNELKKQKLEIIKIADEKLFSEAREIQNILIKSGQPIPAELKLKNILPFCNIKLADDILKTHNELNRILNDITELNKDNHELTTSALKITAGAIENIKDTLAGKKTYKRHKNLERTTEVSGNLVSREA